MVVTYSRLDNYSVRGIFYLLILSRADLYAYNVLHLFCSELLQVVDSFRSANEELCLPPLNQILKMVVLDNLLGGLSGSVRVGGPEGGHDHLVAPVEPVVPHSVRVASTSDLHVLHQTEVANLVGHQLIVILSGTLVDVGHDAAHIVGGLKCVGGKVKLVSAILHSCVCVCVYLFPENIDQLLHVILELSANRVRYLVHLLNVLGSLYI